MKTYIAKPVDWNASPIFRRVGNDGSTATCSAGLIEQCLLTPIFGAQDIRAKYTNVPIVCRHYCLFVDNGLADEAIYTTHRVAPF